jgi:hypothetical protein
MSSIGSILNSVNSSMLSEISSYLSTQTTSGTSSAANTNTTSSDSVNFSQVAKLFKELHQLQSSNPTEFKQVLTEAAGKLKDAAEQSSDPNEASFLNDLASKFQKAADTGDLSTLTPGPAQNGSNNAGNGSSPAGTNQNQEALVSALLASLQSTNTGGQNQNLLSQLLNNTQY